MRPVVLCDANKQEWHHGKCKECMECLETLIRHQSDTNLPMPVQLFIVFKSLPTLHTKVPKSRLMHCTMPLEKSFLAE